MQLKQESLHLGIVTHNGDAMLDFYNGTLGLPIVGEIRFADLGLLKKLQCGNSVIKLLILDKAVDEANPSGGFAAATGFRYCGLAIDNIDEVVKGCRDAGCTVVVDILELRPGVKAAMLEDPDGNYLEFIQDDSVTV